MSNFTAYLLPTFSNKSSTIPSLDELLDHLGFEMWESVVNTFILPPINLIGIAFCSFSFWIFSQSSFENPIFFYYKLLCFVNIIHLLHNIPYCILFSPRYFPMMNTLISSIYQVYYVSASNILYHYSDVLQMGILLHRMKLFSPFVNKHFTATPQTISLAFFLTCLLIDLPFAFGFKFKSLGNYFYLDSNRVKQTASFYYLASSDFSQTIFGQILLGFTNVFLNFFLSLLVGVVLNIASYLEYKLYTNQRRREAEDLQMSSIHNQPTINREIEQAERRERTERKIENNMFYMVLTLCTIAALSRFLFLAGYSYFFINHSFKNTLFTELLSNSIYTIVPTVSIFVFYSFNKMFRDETNKKLGRRSQIIFNRIVIGFNFFIHFFKDKIVHITMNCFR